MEYAVAGLLIVNTLLTARAAFRSGVGRAARRRNPIFIDSSVLIDGRIVALAEAGFLQGNFFIPRSVIAELQYLADTADNEKRARARHGLDVAVQLQQSHLSRVRLHYDANSRCIDVDNQLLRLAKQYHGSICTVDFNLNKVAQVEGIMVLNINQLAKQLRVDYLPGEQLQLLITQKGNDAHQGVGYLEDGTMVVVDQGRPHMGKSIRIEIVRRLQTDAGRMMFAKVVPSRAEPVKSSRSSVKKVRLQTKSPRKTAPLPRTQEDRVVALANNSVTE